MRTIFKILRPVIHGLIKLLYEINDSNSDVSNGNVVNIGCNYGKHRSDGFSCSPEIYYQIVLINILIWMREQYLLT